MAERSHLVRRDEVVLVLVDVQERLAAVMPQRERVVTAASRLLRTAALLGWPVVVTRQNPNGLGGLVPELAALLASAESSSDVRVVDKVAFCACFEPAFGAALHQAGRPQVVICGMEAHICVAQTALGLLAGGREVFVPVDACCSVDPADADVAMDRLRSAGVEVLTSQAVMYEAVREAGTDEFRALLAIVKGA